LTSNLINSLDPDLRRCESSDEMELREVYEDAIRTCDKSLYSLEQIEAWSALAYLPGILDKPLKNGFGWVSCVNKTIEAFALRYPSNRLALLYCRGRSSRQGHATALLKQIEADTIDERPFILKTEASLCSYQLLLKHGWKIIAPQEIQIGGINFSRYLMEKTLL
tara:strand:+ start:1634 stop:2128 length:495 start_codon:yes stop_codon:yes gene_type:complete